ncbi:hypothetical protein VNO77_23162 [Canavalia gladiata]|uniref:Uncharacterized protein n=1 Tax=Canavalia gladiata TaxID=3824 RepID=A0AAN9L6H5_CANGL
MALDRGGFPLNLRGRMHNGLTNAYLSQNNKGPHLLDNSVYGDNQYALFMILKGEGRRNWRFRTLDLWQRYDQVPSNRRLTLKLKSEGHYPKWALGSMVGVPTHIPHALYSNPRNWSEKGGGNSIKAFRILLVLSGSFRSFLEASLGSDSPSQSSFPYRITPLENYLNQSQLQPQSKFYVRQFCVVVPSYNIVKFIRTENIILNSSNDKVEGIARRLEKRISRSKEVLKRWSRVHHSGTIQKLSFSQTRERTTEAHKNVAFLGKTSRYQQRMEPHLLKDAATLVIIESAPSQRVWSSSYRRWLTNLYSDLNDVEPICVLDHVFVLRKHIRECILGNFRRSGLVVLKTDNDLQRPIVLGLLIKMHISIRHLARQHISIDITQGICEVLLLEALSGPVSSLNLFEKPILPFPIRSYLSDRVGFNLGQIDAELQQQKVTTTGSSIRPATTKTLCGASLSHGEYLQEHMVYYVGKFLHSTTLTASGSPSSNHMLGLAIIEAAPHLSYSSAPPYD